MTKPIEYGPPILGECRVSSRFGARRDPFTGELAGHDGIDLAVPEGRPVIAVASGTVYRRDVADDGKMDGNGNAVWLRDAAGREWAYLHLRSVTAAVLAAPPRGSTGQGYSVVRGQILGFSGNTGRSRGPHLHLGCYENGEPVDPCGLLGLSFGTLPRTLHEGLSGHDVRAVQLLVGAEPDGLFGPATAAAVRSWQAAHGLVADGWVGPATRAALGIS